MSKIKGQKGKSVMEDLPEPTGFNSTPVAEPSSGKVTLTKNELEELIDSKLETLRAENDILKHKQGELHRELGGGEWQVEESLKPRTHHSWLKLYRENADEEYGLIVKWEKYKTITNELTGAIRQELYRITCLYPNDSTKEFTIPLLDLARISDREKVEVIKIDRKKLVKIHGKVQKSIVDKEGYTRSANISDPEIQGEKTGNWVDLREVRDETTVTIKRNSGQTYTMSDLYLNS